MHREPEVIFQELVESIEARQVERLKGLLGGGKPVQRATKPKAKKPQAIAVGLTKPRTATPIRVENKKQGSQQNRPAIEELIKRLVGHLGGLDRPAKVKELADALRVTPAELVWPLRKLKQKKLVTQTGQRNEAAYKLA